MRIVHVSVVVLMLALVGCAGDAEPDPTPAPSDNIVRQPYQPLTDGEVADYKQDFASMFDTSTVAARVQQHAAGGASADVAGQSNVALLKYDAEGNMVTDCVHSEEDAMNFLSTAQAGVHGLEVK